MTDLGLTHIALPVSDMNRSLAFYAKYARMQIVHQRRNDETGSEVVWISDHTRPFVIVLISTATVEHPLLPWSHLGVGCESREEVDRLCREAQAEGILITEPTDSGYPVGYWALIRDPDSHTLEISYGQEVGMTVEQAT